jgi:DNA polymerase III subunit epsilon
MAGAFDWLRRLFAPPTPERKTALPPSLGNSTTRRDFGQDDVRPPPAIPAERASHGRQEAVRLDPFVAIDVETTGLSPAKGHRIVSLALMRFGAIGGNAQTDVECLHLVFNPGRKSEPRAAEIHGLADDFLSRQDRFADHASAIAEFISEANLVGHNVDFDLGFLDSEMRRCGIEPTYRMSTCTMTIFRSRHRGEKASLDNVAQRFGIDVSARARHHGALIDAAIAAQVYAVLKGGIHLSVPSPLPGFSNARH